MAQRRQGHRQDLAVQFSTMKPKSVWGLVILLISLAALPFSVFLAVAQPEGTHVPPTLLVLSFGMVVVGLNTLYPREIFRWMLRMAALILFTVGIGGTLIVLFAYKLHIGDRPGQYAPLNFFVFLFLASLFLYASPSEKVRRRSSPVVWFVFGAVLLILCSIIAVGLPAMLQTP
jgi:hypothetical protein